MCDMLFLWDTFGLTLLLDALVAQSCVGHFWSRKFLHTDRKSIVVKHQSQISFNGRNPRTCKTGKSPSLSIRARKRKGCWLEFCFIWLDRLIFARYGVSVLHATCLVHSPGLCMGFDGQRPLRFVTVQRHLKTCHGDRWAYPF